MRKKIKIFEMFAGYGGASFALKKAGIEFECVGYSEIDKYACQCYEQNHKTYNRKGVGWVSPPNYDDCTKIDPNTIPDFDLLTGGFPCQAFSVAGKGLGEQDTRGTLFHDIIRIAEVKKPKYMLLENVKGLTFKNHKKTFEKILSELKRIGYEVKWKILNTKEHGIPQNRERVFFVCKRVGYQKEDGTFYCYESLSNYFKFPQKEELKIFLKDILESEVDEKYYLKEEQIKKILSKKHTFHERRFVDKISSTLLSRDYKDPKIIQVNPNGKYIDKRVYHPDGISPAMNCYQNNDVKILDLYNKIVKDDGVSICLTEPHHNNLRIAVPFNVKGCALRGREGKTNLEFRKDEVANALLANPNNSMVGNQYRIRKLTPKECFRLMGFLNDEINLDGLSDTQRYKLAGNGWDINLVSKIFKEMFKDDQRI